MSIDGTVGKFYHHIIQDITHLLSLDLYLTSKNLYFIQRLEVCPVKGCEKKMKNGSRPLDYVKCAVLNMPNDGS